jgi:hypothetical protein
VNELADRLPFSLTALRVGLAVFVVAWLLGPDLLREVVPIWLVFAIALGLEVNFLVGALRSPGTRSVERGPQDADRERFGFGEAADELLLVRDGEEELWIPYAGETDDELDELIAEARESEVDEVAPVVEGGRTALAVRRFAVGLGVIGALFAAVWFVESRTGWSGLSGETRAAAVERFSAEAARIAGKPVSIRCDEARDYVGFVQHADGVALVGGDRAYLTPERCYDLYRLAFENDVTASRTARAIAVLAHEAWHLEGEDDEATTECYALQSGVELGVRLGLSEGRARQLMRQQLVENSLRGVGSIEYAVSGECRNGGALDLNPGTTAFP